MRVQACELKQARIDGVQRAVVVRAGYVKLEIESSITEANRLPPSDLGRPSLLPTFPTTYTETRYLQRPVLAGGEKAR